jgi:nitric oxide reductase subunit B
MQPTRKLWQGLAIVFVLSFAVLGWLGREIYVSAPPIPTVKTTAGETLYTAAEIQEGQRAWLAAGGQQLGSVWGHGSYVAPDWSADWLHREATAYRDVLAGKMYGQPYERLALGDRGAVDALVKQDFRRNTYDAATNTVTVTPERAQAIAQTQKHYTGLFGDEPALSHQRERYAMTDNALPRAEDRKALSGFFLPASPAWCGGTTAIPRSPIPPSRSATRSSTRSPRPRCWRRASTSSW